MRIQIASSSELHRRIIKNALGRIGYADVSFAGKGKSVLGFLQDISFDLIVLEKHLPDMGGLELTQEIRKLQKSAYTPILMLGEEFTRDEVIDAINGGVNQMLIKPVHPDSLATKIRAVRPLRR